MRGQEYFDNNLSASGNILKLLSMLNELNSKYMEEYVNLCLVYGQGKKNKDLRMLAVFRNYKNGLMTIPQTELIITDFDSKVSVEYLKKSSIDNKGNMIYLDINKHEKKSIKKKTLKKLREQSVYYNSITIRGLCINLTTLVYKHSFDYALEDIVKQFKLYCEINKWLAMGVLSKWTDKFISISNVED